MIQKVLVLLFMFLACSCERIKDKNVTIWVYKMKNDYSKNVPVRLSENKLKITVFPGPNDLDLRWPVKLTNSYFLNGSIGSNTGYLSLTIEEYNKYETSPGADSLYKLLIDKEPFIAFYQRDDYNSTFRDENGAYGIDTILLNELIRNNELEKYFVKLK